MNWRGFWQVLWRWIAAWFLGFSLYLISPRLEWISFIWIMCAFWWISGMAQKLGDEPSLAVEHKVANAPL